MPAAIGAVGWTTAPDDPVGAASPARYRTAMKPYLAAFVTVFLAELGDKTQLATLLFATTPRISKPWLVAAAAAALTAATVIAVVAGEQVGRIAQPAMLRVLAGVGFVVIGVWLVAVR